MAPRLKETLVREGNRDSQIEFTLEASSTLVIRTLSGSVVSVGSDGPSARQRRAALRD